MTHRRAATFACAAGLFFGGAALDAGEPIGAGRLPAGLDDRPGSAALRIEQALQALGARDARQRKGAREALVEVGAPALIPVMEHIRDPEFLMRWEVVNLLGHLGDVRAVGPLVERAVEDENRHVRWRALWALAVLEADDAAISGLLERLERPGHRWNAAVGLSMFARSEAIPVLTAGLAASDDWVRFEAVFGLGRSFDVTTSERLLPLLAHREKRTRQEVVMTLGRIRDEAALRGLTAALADESPDIRWRAAMGLGSARHEPSVELLRELLSSESSDQVRHHLRRAIEKIEGARGQISAK